MAQNATPKALIEAGLTRSFAHHVVAGTRKVRMPLAIWLHDERGLIVKQLEGKTKREIDLLRSMYPPQPPEEFARPRVAAHDAAAA